MKFRSIFMIAVLVFTTFAASLLPGGATVASDNLTGGPVIDAKLTQALLGATEPVEAIVTFHGYTAPTEEQVNLLKQAGITQGITMKALPMAGVLLTAEQLQTLSKAAEIRSIYLNQQLTYDNFDSTALTGVDKLRTDAAITKQNGGLPVSGKGITVLVNDSGVDGTHEDIKFGNHLLQNVVGSTNLNAQSELLPITYVEDVPNTDTNSGHGTHVAGTVGATGAMSNGKYEGVAPGAGLIGYGSGAGLAILDTLGGFDYALTHQFQYGIRVITNSWGNTGDVNTPFDPNDPVNVATKMSFDRGIVVVFSAGNSGPGEGTITGNFKKAPWIVTVAAGDKQGKLADFSSRGVKDRGAAVTVDGQTFIWEDRPTLTAPGVDIISTRVIAPIPLLGAADDAENIETAYLPYYTTMSGTSMAAPHIAGVIALILEADPTLSPLEVKRILEQTATNIPGTEAWEAGAGYVNAYAAVDLAFNAKEYGKTLNITRDFNSNVNVAADRMPFTVDYNPVTLASDNQYPFTVQSGLTELVARVDAKGVLETTGNTINLVLIAPDGTEYSSGISLLFPLYTDRTVAVTSPMAGEWKAELRGLRGSGENPTSGASLPEQVQGELTFKTAGSFDGLDDIAGHPAEATIKLAVNERLVDGFSDRKFRPDQAITRLEMATYLVAGAEIRQFLPAGGTQTYGDVKAEDIPFVEAVAARGAALRDGLLVQKGVMTATGDGAFSPKNAVLRAELAYSLVQSLGLQEEALARNGTTITVQVGDERLPIEDAANIPPGLEGYVQVALDMNILNAYFSVTQGPYDLEPTLHAAFKPTQKVTRADYSVAAARFFSTYLMP